jgi:hypothetical protein
MRRSNMEITEHPLFAQLAALELDRAHFVIFGSAPLWIRRLRSDLGDLDIVARATAWEHALTHGQHGIAPSGSPVMSFCDGQIEIFPEWLPPCTDTDRLIDQAETIAGFRFARLDDVRAYYDNELNGYDPSAVREITGPV